ncbi:hypothetical protein [Gorillibacterium timonense]|uniref:hypothetical protein n=1 Tax=Gorillibacterium timonense TaxID=1689269 RepID=UPI00071CD494|nr:hypothetical protein [Gorillibacterium timonense]
MFQSEEELVQRLVQHYNRNFTIQEIGVGYGISDLLIIRNQSELNRFICERNGIYLKHLDEVKVFDYIRKRKSVEVEELHNTLFISKQRLKYNILKRLEEIGAVLMVENTYIRNQDFTLFNPNVTAIEAKLEDWTKGLAQAIRYQRFANKSYLALDEQYVHRADQSECKRFKVGLISVGSRVREIIEAPPIKPLDPLMRYKVAEEIIAKCTATYEKHC